MGNQAIISVDGVSKAYRIWETPSSRLISPLLSASAKVLPDQSKFANRLNQKAAQYYRDFWALKDISFELKKGESLGIIGRNGSGKSTLLQIIAGTLQPTTGTVQVNGRVAALLELGSGFNPEFTGRENVYLNAAVLGLSSQEVDARFDEIAAFADIGDFIEQPVKTYSSGMMIRLAFAVATSVSPDVLIVDEALSVGDVFFQQKCFKRIHSMLQSGVSLLFVSHDTAAVQNLCTRGILLQKGLIAHSGPPEECTSRYFAIGGEKTQASTNNSPQQVTASGKIDRKSDEIKTANIISAAKARHGERAMEFVAIVFYNNLSQAVPSIEMGRVGQVHAIVRANATVTEPAVGLRIYDRMNNLVFAAGNRQLKIHLPSLNAGEEIHIQFDLTFSVNPGPFTFTVDCSEPCTDGPNLGLFHDVVEGLGPIEVHFEQNAMWPFYGIAQLPLQLHFEKIVPI